ncbi:MAG TPA: hemolysin III family protein [Actinomycetota bacterium]|nr:hemolysin III family protein [Actinomycetota bacterium]
MGTAVPLHARPKPRLRGRLHQAAFFAAIPAGLVLVLLAPGPAARIGALIYWASLLFQFGVSAAYHLGSWDERSHTRMRRLDHSAIFVLIAGTYTPFCLLALRGTTAVVVLAIVWGGAAVGIAIKLYRVDLNVLSGFLYLGLGWVGVFVLPAMIRALSPTELALVVAGGVLYSVGALVLALKRPDPAPATFGFHEVWHAATIAAAACLYTSILLVYLGS